MATRIYMVTPSYKPVGGVVKLFDYMNHALDLGLDPVVVCPTPPEDDLPLFRLERFARLAPGGDIPHLHDFRVPVEPRHLVFFTWPRHYGELASRIPRVGSPERLIHIVQGVRHSDPGWIDGYATRLLGRPMARIFVSEPARERCLPFLNRESLSRVVPEGHAWDFFSRERTGRPEGPIRVGYATWKSDLGVRVEAAFAGDPRFEFRSIRDIVGWDELRHLYHWSDVFLGTPLREEGFFLPGLEAMAAGALVVVPDVYGNRAYCEWGVNCLPATHGSVPSYREALEHLHGLDAAGWEALRAAAYATLPEHSLDAEREGFAAFLAEVDERWEAHLAARVTPGAPAPPR